MGPWSCSNDHLREAGRTSATPIATAHRSTIARTPKLPTFLPYSTVPVAQSAAVSLNLGLNKEDANGYELVTIAPSGVNRPTITYLTRSTHPGDCQTPDAAQRRAEQEQQARREVETRLAQESAARRVAEARVVELEAFLRQLRQAVGIDPTE